MAAEKEPKTEGKKLFREVEFAKDESGKYVYVGGYHVLDIDEREYTRAVKCGLLIMIPSLLATILSGSINGTGLDGAAGIMVFYLIGLVLQGFAVFALVRMLHYGRTMRNYDYKNSAARMPVLAVGLFLSGAGGLICIGIRLIRRIYDAAPLGASVLILSFALEIAGGRLLGKKTGGWVWEEKPGKYASMKAEADKEKENGSKQGSENGGTAK